MARATKSTNTRSSVKVGAPKKKIGRPPGSKNRVSAAPKSKVAAAPKKAAVRQGATPAPVRMNKAELEAHVVKLERSLARARAQTAELKKALKEAQQPAETTKTPVAKTSTKTTRTKAGNTPLKRARRSKVEIAAAEEAPETDAVQPEE